MKIRAIASRALTPGGILIILFVLSIPLVTPYLRGDGVGYYAWLRSPVIDHDLQFKDEFEHGDPSFIANTFEPDGTTLKPGFATSTGHVRNQWSVGPAVMWLPFFLTAHVLVYLAGLVGVHFATDGYSLPYLWFTGLGSAIYAFAGLFLAFRIAKSFASPWAAFVAAIAVWGASSLPVYQYFLPFWPFACGVFVAALLLTIWYRGSGWGLWRWMVMGVLSGVLVMVHPIGVAWIALPAAALVRLDAEGWRDQIGARVRAAAVFGAGVIIGNAPQLIGKWIVHGSPLDSGYTAEWTFLHPHFLRTLFGAEHGLISWTPIAGISLIGFWWIFRHKDRRLATGLFVVFMVMLFLVASYATAEESSFGNRFFVLFIPGFVVGASGVAEALWAKRKVFVVTATALLIVWNGLFAFQWAWGLTPKRGPVNWATVIHNQFTTAPSELVHAATLFVTDRHALIQLVQQKDLERLQSGGDIGQGG